MAKPFGLVEAERLMRWLDDELNRSCLRLARCERQWEVDAWLVHIGEVKRFIWEVRFLYGLLSGLEVSEVAMGYRVDEKSVERVLAQYKRVLEQEGDNGD